MTPLNASGNFSKLWRRLTNMRRIAHVLIALTAVSTLLMLAFGFLSEIGFWTTVLGSGAWVEICFLAINRFMLGRRNPLWTPRWEPNTSKLPFHRTWLSRGKTNTSVSKASSAYGIVICVLGLLIFMAASADPSLLLVALGMTGLGVFLMVVPQKETKNAYADLNLGEHGVEYADPGRGRYWQELYRAYSGVRLEFGIQLSGAYYAHIILKHPNEAKDVHITTSLLPLKKDYTPEDGEALDRMVREADRLAALFGVPRLPI